MTQTVIGIFDAPDAAHAAEETLIDRGVDESSMHLTAKSGGDQSMKGIRDFLSQLFGPDESDDAASYAEAIEHGAALLTVDVSDDVDIEPIQAAMQDAGVLDIEDFMERLHQQGGAGGRQSQQPPAAESKVMPVVEEQLEVGKEKVGKGKVRVSARMVETPVQEKVTLTEERAAIERRPADRPISPEEIERLSEESVEIEETAESPVVSKSARVVEEVEVGKETSERSETIEDTVRHTEVDVARADAPEAKDKSSDKSSGKAKGKKQR